MDTAKKDTGSVTTLLDNGIENALLNCSIALFFTKEISNELPRTLDKLSTIEIDEELVYNKLQRVNV